MGQYLLDGEGRVVAFYGYMDLGQAIDIATGLVESGELFGVAGQGAVSGLADTLFDDREGAIEPDGDAVLEQQVAIGG